MRNYFKIEYLNHVFKHYHLIIFRYVPNPIKVLGEIKARGGDIETVEGEVVAGDAGDVDVVSLKGKVQLIFGNINYTKRKSFRNHEYVLYRLHVLYFQNLKRNQEAHAHPAQVVPFVASIGG